MGETGDTALAGMGRPQGGENVLQGGGVVNPIVWVRDVGPFGGNAEEGGRDSHWVPLTYNGEASVAVRRQDMGYAWGGNNVGGSGNAVGDDLHRETADNCGTVGGATPTF